MTIATITDPAPTVSWVDPTQDVNNNVIPGGEITGYEVGIRDLNAAGSVAGTYANTLTTSATVTTGALLSATGTLKMVYGGSYAVAMRTLAGTPPGPSAWSPEQEFLWQPVAAPQPPVFTLG